MNSSSPPLTAHEILESKLKSISRFQLPPSTRLTYWFSRHWMLVFSVVYGLFVGLPFLAPVFMQIGWEIPGRALYFVYQFFCHQLPDRSFFLFGPQRMYDLATIQAAWQNTTNPMVLRQFIGNPEMGWKVAWSDRMIAMYGSILLAAWGWWLLRNRVKPLRWWGLVLFSLPMFLDGVTHFLSDLGGIDQGFRYTNAWLASLTGHAFPAAFYAGNAWGSFNSWMRLLTGFVFGVGIVWFAFPYLEEIALATQKQIELRLQAIQTLSGRLFHGERETQA
ncbi:MAG: hypothetical protein Fur0022_01720 [Anaerolineales bacterium]